MLGLEHETGLLPAVVTGGGTCHAMLRDGSGFSFLSGFATLKGG